MIFINSLFYIICASLFVLIYKNAKKPDLIILFALFLLALLRGESVGSDTPGYIQAMKDGMYNIKYDDVKELFSIDTYLSTEFGSKFRREWLFSIIYSTINVFFPSPLVALNVIICIITIIYYKSFQCLFDRKGVALCLIIYFCTYLYFASFNTIRQSLSQALVFFSMIRIYKYGFSWRKPTTYIPLIMSSFIHTAAIYMFPLALILYKIPIKYKIKVILLIFALVIDMFGISRSLSIFEGYLLSYEDSAVAFSELINRYYTTKLHFVAITLHILMVVFFLSLTYNQEGMNKGLSNIWFGGLIIYIILIGAANIGRITEYLYSMQLIIVPMLLYSIKQVNLTKYYRMCVLAFSHYTIWLLFYSISRWHSVVPYTPFFFE